MKQAAVVEILKSMGCPEADSSVAQVCEKLEDLNIDHNAIEYVPKYFSAQLYSALRKVHVSFNPLSERSATLSAAIFSRAKYSGVPFPLRSEVYAVSNHFHCHAESCKDLFLLRSGCCLNLNIWIYLSTI